MTAAGPMVLVLLGVAALVAVLTVLAARGRIEVSMDAPDNPWWAGRRNRRSRRRAHSGTPSEQVSEGPAEAPGTTSEETPPDRVTHHS